MTYGSQLAILESYGEDLREYQHLWHEQANKPRGLGRGCDLNYRWDSHAMAFFLDKTGIDINCRDRVRMFIFRIQSDCADLVLCSLSARC